MAIIGTFGEGVGGARRTTSTISYSFKSSVAPPAVVAPPTPPAVAGIEPQAYEAILYGKDIPLFIGGKMLIGGRIIEGPFFGGTQSDPTVSFIAYHAHNIGNGGGAADYSNTVITSARLRGQEVWNGSYIATDKLPVGKFDWRPGHTAQVPFAQSVARYGANAIAYTEGIISSWEDIPLKPFGGIIPFPSVLVENSRYGPAADGIPRSEAISRLLEYMRYEPFEFEVNVSGSDPAWLAASDMKFEDFLRQLRAIFVNYRIEHTDKIRITEPTEFSVSAEITNLNAHRGTLQFKRSDPIILPRQKSYTFIDVDRDYEMNTVFARQDRFPIPTTDAVNSVSIELPIATTSAQAVADVHVSLYEELAIRSQMSGTVNNTLFGMECGDGARFADSPINFVGRVMEAIHDFHDMSVQFNAGEVLNCGAEVSTSAVLIGANSQFGEDEFDVGFGYAPVVPTEFGSGLPARTRANSLRGMAIADVVVSGNGEAIFVNDSEAHAADFRHVFTDDDYIYYVDVDAGSLSVAALIVRISRTDFSDRTVLDWGTWFGLGVYAYSACFYLGKIYLGASGAGNGYVIIADLSDFSTSGLSSVTLGASLRPLGMAGLGNYIYLATFDVGSSDNFIHRINISDETVDSIAGTAGGEGRLYGGVADQASGKVFFLPGGKDDLFTYPTVNDRMIGVVDTNVTFDDDAIDYFSVLQDTNVDFAYGTQGELSSYCPWIVGNAVRLLCQTSDSPAHVRIASFSTDDYTVADAGVDLVSQVTVLGAGSGFFPTSARADSNDVFILCGSNSTSPFVGLLKVSHSYASAEMLDELE